MRGALQEARAVHQRVLDAAQVLESDIERLSQGLSDVQCACPHSYSGSSLQSQSLDRQPRSLRRPWQERRVTFWEPEVEPDPEEGSYRGALGCSSRIFLENSGRVPPSAQRQETAHPPGRPTACQDAKGRGNYPMEPSIKDIETWLDWQAHQKDMPYWWTELTAIPGVEDPQKLAWKICTSFLIPAVRSKVFLGQGYTAPPAPRCLTQSVFLPDELSYEDVWQQPFLLTVAYAQGLQYWAERLNPPADLDFCPLVRSVLELKERVKEHIVFSKQDVIQGLEGLTQELHASGPNWYWKCRLRLCWGPGDMCHHFLIIWIPPWEETHHRVPQLGFKWRTDQLVQMQALLILPLKLPPPLHQGLIDQSHCPIQSDRRGKVACISCDHFGKEHKFGNDQCHPQGHGDHLSQRRHFPEFPYGSCFLRAHSSKRDNQQPWCHCERTREEWCRVRTP